MLCALYHVTPHHKEFASANIASLLLPILAHPKFLNLFLLKFCHLKCLKINQLCSLTYAPLFHTRQSFNVTLSLLEQ